MTHAYLTLMLQCSSPECNSDIAKLINYSQTSTTQRVKNPLGHLRRISGLHFHIIKRKTDIADFPSFLFPADGFGLRFKFMEVYPALVPFDLADDDFAVRLIYGNQVNLVASIFFPIVRHDIVKSGFAVELTEVAFKYPAGECVVVGPDFLTNIIQVADFHSTAVFIDEPKPEVEEIVIDTVFHIAASRCGKIWTIAVKKVIGIFEFVKITSGLNASIGFNLSSPVES